jgi:hypothetical protein
MDKQNMEPGGLFSCCSRGAAVRISVAMGVFGIYPAAESFRSLQVVLCFHVTNHPVPLHANWVRGAWYMGLRLVLFHQFDRSLLTGCCCYCVGGGRFATLAEAAALPV